jgi:serine/threonine-protein kinase
VRVDHPGTSRRYPAGDVIKQHPAPGDVLTEGGVLDVVVSSGPPLVRVPTVVGLSCTHAIAALAGVGFSASCPVQLEVYSTTIAPGRAVAVYNANAQDPNAAPYGAALTVQLSKGRPPIPVPNVVGLPVDEATTTLQRAGFVTVVTKAFSSTVPAGNVVSTTPAPSAPLQPGGTVTVVESKGVGVTVPGIGKVSLHDAWQTLVDAGFVVSIAPRSPRHGLHHWATVPGAGAVVAQGTIIELMVAT